MKLEHIHCENSVNNGSSFTPLKLMPLKREEVVLRKEKINKKIVKKSKYRIINHLKEGYNLISGFSAKFFVFN